MKNFHETDTEKEHPTDASSLPELPPIPLPVADIVVVCVAMVAILTGCGLVISHVLSGGH